LNVEKLEILYINGVKGVLVNTLSSKKGTAVKNFRKFYHRELPRIEIDKN